MIKIGLPKGNIINHSLDVIKTFVKTEVSQDQLYYSANNTHLYILKQQDIPRLVNDGLLDIGITSTEWFYEKEYDLSIVETLDWYNGRVSLLSVKDNPIMDKKDIINCVARYPHVARKFFHDKGIENVIIDQISGSSEGLVPTLYDCIVDCVETGKTSKAHNLVEEETILDSKIIIITRKQPDKKRNMIKLQPIFTTLRVNIAL